MDKVEILNELHKRLDADPRRDHKANMIVGGDRHLRNVPTITCADGFTMSVQASAFHYCAPRDSGGPWHKVEIGFPSERVEALMPYLEDANEPTGTVYGYVPLGIVADVIEAHGGFKS